MDILVGLRVLRGPDWSGEDTDGGEGYLGTVTHVKDNHEVQVLWDMGEVSTCRTGQGGKFDLRVFDSAPIGVRHPESPCGHCGDKGIVGTLWRCHTCPSCCLCSQCYSDDRHDIGHPFTRVDDPTAAGQLQTKRRSSVKVRTIGLHPGAKVVRGRDWEYGDRDGGQGSEGEVQGYEDTPEAPRSRLRVRWPDESIMTCRLGEGGKVDLTCVDEEVGPFYYRDHLPFLDTTKPPPAIVKKSPQTPTAPQIPNPPSPPNPPNPPSTQNSTATGSRKDKEEEEEEITNPALNAFPGEKKTQGQEEEDEELRVGDHVAIKVDEEELQVLQKDSGGYTARMLRCIGRTGEVTNISSRGVVSVQFENSRVRISYRFNPKALLKVEGSFAENDLVRIRDDLQLLKLLNRRIGWTSAMEKTPNKVGRVVKVDEDGDLRVDFGGVRWVFSPACCRRVSHDGRTSVDSLFSSSSFFTSGSFAGGAENSRIVKDSGEDGDPMMRFRQVRDLVRGYDRRDHGRSVRSLFAAIDHGDADYVRKMCQEDPSMVEREDDGLTPLIFASVKGRESCARVLLDLGADVNRSASDDYRKTPLSAVAEGKREELADLLLSRGARTDQVYGRGHTLAHLCAIRNKAIIMQYLVIHGADLNVKDDDDHTPLHLAIAMRRHEVMVVLVASPQVNIHLPNDKDFDMIQLAAITNNTKALERLLARDCSKVERMRDGHSTALHIAATSDHAESVRMLVLQGGASVDARQAKSMQTALMLACHGAKLETVEALLELGADVTLADSSGHTALHLAIGGGVDGKRRSEEVVTTCRIQIANILISNGAYVDAEDHQRRDPFTYGTSAVRNAVRAFMKRNPDVVRKKQRKDVHSVLQSLGVSGLDSHGPGQLKEALRGIQLPCGICGAAKSDVTLTPCAHRCVCRACSVTVARCPLCDERVEGKDVSED